MKACNVQLLECQNFKQKAQGSIPLFCTIINAYFDTNVNSIAQLSKNSPKFQKLSKKYNQVANRCKVTMDGDINNDLYKNISSNFCLNSQLPVGWLT